MALVLFYVLTALQLGDIWTTQYALRNIKAAKEANPVVRKLMDKLGILGGLLVLKVPFIVLIWMYPMPMWLLLSLIAFYGYIVGNNARIILKHK